MSRSRRSPTRSRRWRCDTLGQTPAIRIGRAPKRLLVYRAAEPFAGFKYPPVEVLGLGQQFVAYGRHPDTGEPYQWPVETLADLAPEELPAITEAQARGFAEAGLPAHPSGAAPSRASGSDATRRMTGRTSPSSVAPSPRSRRPCASSSTPTSTTTAGSGSGSPSRARSARTAGRCSRPGRRARARTTRRPRPRPGRASSRRRSALAPSTSSPSSRAGRRHRSCSSTERSP